MLSYCLKCREKSDNKNPRFIKTKNGRIHAFNTAQIYQHCLWNIYEK